MSRSAFSPAGGHSGIKKLVRNTISRIGISITTAGGTTSGESLLFRKGANRALFLRVHRRSVEPSLAGLTNPGQAGFSMHQKRAGSTQLAFGVREFCKVVLFCEAYLEFNSVISSADIAEKSRLSFFCVQ